LEGDQVASLLVRMAADGFDFSKAALLDRRWKLRLLWIARAYQDTKQIELLKLRLLKTSAICSSPHLELVKSAYSSFDQMADVIDELSQPWLARDTKPRKNYDAYRELIDAYKEEFGDWNDPEFRKKVEAEVEEARQKRLGIWKGE
jgi:hypothetical protein